MKKVLAILIVVGAIFTLSTPSYANVLFSDNFNDNSFDTTKWGTEIYTNGGPAGTATEAGGKIDFRLWGGNPGGSIYAYSKNAAASYGWSQIDFTGKWQYTTGGINTAGVGILIYDANNPNKYLFANYSPYEQKIYFYDSNASAGVYSRGRGLPEQAFSFSITPAGWSFVDGGTTYINNRASTSFAGATSFKIKIGGGDYWYYSSNNEHAYFDDILLKDNAVPEPAMMALTALGLGALGFRKRKSV